jgi:hypothetical protein
MSPAEYNAMKQTGKVQVGAGGVPYVTKAGPGSFISSKPGSVYAEFKVPNNSVIGAGKADWGKMVSVNANAPSRLAIEKSGGQYMEDISVTGLSDILQVR